MNKIKLHWQILISMGLGVIIGFILAMFQILSQKGEIYSLRSKVRKMQVELDSLRNESIEDEIELKDETDNTRL